VTDALDGPRGPDVLHRIHVERGWLERGAVVEFELPRNVTCAACDGGGCDACDRAGAFSLRGRGEPAELVQVTLPAQPAAEQPPSSGRRGLVLRIPEKGGLPPTGSDLPRGLLLLRVIPAQSADPGVTRARRVEPERAAAALVGRGAAGRRPPRSVQIVAVLVALWILFLVVLRVTGRG
jgi:hypothetical protein